VSRGSSANLDVLLQSAAEWARDQEARYFDKAKEGTIRYLARTENDPIHQARRVFREALFPGHPYGALASASRLKKVSARDADRWLSAEIRPERATLIVVSDQAPTPELWSAIEGHFGGWRRGDVDRAAAAAPPAPAARRIILVDRPGASQALLAMGVRAPPRRARDEAALGAVRWLVQDRLNQRIRVEEGVSYGVQVQLLDHEQGAALFVAATVDRDAAASSLATILAAPGALAEKPLPVDQVTRARWQVARAFAYGFDTVGDVAGALADLVRDELPADHYEKQPASIAALDPARIQAAAARLGVGKEAGVILGDAAVLRPQLEKAGFTVEAAAAP
jgi:zinc protease